MRSRYINFLEKEIDLPVFSDELYRRILPQALSDWYTLPNPAEQSGGATLVLSSCESATALLPCVALSVVLEPSKVVPVVSNKYQR